MSRPATMGGFATGALHDEDTLDGRAAAGQRFVGDGLEREGLATAVLAVGGNQQHSAGIVDRSARDCAEKPPKTMEWVAPIRAQACMATTPSTDIGR